VRPGDGLLTGCCDRELCRDAAGHCLLPEVAEAFSRLADDAADNGFDLRIASAWRSFDRQLHIWNAKASGERPIHDEQGRPLEPRDLSPERCIEAILRFSALPGASRHHWGTDVDVFDGAALPGDYRLSLSPQEVAPGGVFDPLHCWLDARIAAGRSYGFYRPYDRDRGGVAPERWHLSYAPLARLLLPRLTEDVLRRCWATSPGTLQGFDVLDARLPDLLRRYVYNVAPAPGD